MPPRLVDGEGEVAELLRKVERQARQAPSETAAWERTLRQLGRDSGRGRLRVGLAAAAGAVVGAVALYAALSRTAHVGATGSGFGPGGTGSGGTGPGATGPGLAAELPGRPRSTPIATAMPTRTGTTGTAPVAAPATGAMAASPVPPARAVPGEPAVTPAVARSEVGGGRPPAPETTPASESPRIQLGREAVGLPAGHAELLGEAEVMLSRGGSARAFTTVAAATVDLTAGEVELHVEKRPPEARHLFEVVAGAYRFTALGTTFRVARANGDVTLSVTEGRVAVARGTERLTVVTAGGFWAGTAREARARRSASLAMAGSPTHGDPRGGTGWSAALPSSAAADTSARSPAPASLVAGAGPALTPPSLVPSSMSSAASPRPSQPAFEPALAPPAPESSPRGPTGSGAGASAPALAPALAGRPVAVRSTAGPAPAGSRASSSGCAGRGAGGTPMTRGTPKAQIECLLGEGRGADLGAEVALYEAARLYRDDLGDTGHAIATLRELRRRFPSGALAAEAGLSLAELLPAVGRYREALAETAAVLGAHPTPGRTAELHLLRGDLLRTGLGDCRAAAAEYAQATGAGSDTVADPASFFAGVCLQKLGDADGARRAFESYLARPHPLRRAEAVQRLRELDAPGRAGW